MSQDRRRASAANSGDIVLAVAIRFEELAFEKGVSLDGYGAPYMAKAFSRAVHASGIIDRKKPFQDGAGNEVARHVVGWTVVRYFWDHVPWESERVMHQFSDPQMFKDCLQAVEDRWENRRVKKKLISQRTRRIS